MRGQQVSRERFDGRCDHKAKGWEENTYCLRSLIGEGGPKSFYEIE